MRSRFHTHASGRDDEDACPHKQTPHCCPRKAYPTSAELWILLLEEEAPRNVLAFLAITVGTSIVSYVPLIGQSLSRLLPGGPEVGARTLLNFYSLHIAILPLSIFGLMMYHFWRIRKDGGLTLPKSLTPTEAEEKPERVTTIPHLVRKELVFAAAWIAAVLLFSMLVPAPLEGIANPGLSPNPAKAPWYFMGLQELLLHFHPLVGAILTRLLLARKKE